MGRWSELSLVMGDQTASAARWALVKARSGEVQGPPVGFRVGLSPFRRHSGLAERDSSIEAPRAAASSQPDAENQDG